MSIAQHHAMLLALQQQAEYDPAAMAQLQMLGAAGLQQEVRVLDCSSCSQSRTPEVSLLQHSAMFISTVQSCWGSLCHHIP